MINHFWKSMVLSLAFFFSLLCYSNSSYSQDIQTTPNLIQPYGWQGCLTQHQGFIWGGTSGGPCPVQRSGDGAILFSYGQSTLSQTIAVNQALSGTGIVVRGYDYSWTLKNANAGSGQSPSFDPLNINVSLYDLSNAVIESRNYDYSRRINDWTTFTGTEEFTNRYSLANLSNLRITMTGVDAGYWAGYYGPEIRNIDVRLRYSFDQCAANPLSSPDCPGYQEAYKTQQCSANPLFDSSCPGYEVANFQFQCSSNPLYSPGCPGYTQAYFTQQCSLNILWNPECPGYQQAYFNQQCDINPLYNRECPGYAQAYFNQQCTANPLYNNQCPGYAQAYFNQQCTANPLYNNQCPGYAQAYFNQQCSLNALYNPECPGYQQAFFNQQCTANQLYSTQCPLYQQAYFARQCELNPLHSNQCVGYQQAFFNQQCQLNTLYNSECPGYQVAYQEKLRNDACRANPQSSPSCPGYTVSTASPVPVITSTSNTVTTVVAVAPQDPVAAVTETPVTSDPVVNQAIAAPKETARESPSTSNNTQPLGTGLTVPGMRIQPPSQTQSRSTSNNRASTNNQSRAASVSRQVTTNAESIARDAQTQQQDAAMAQMANVPGFDAYQNSRIPDAPFYQPRDIYRGVVIRDNDRAQRALSQRSDRLHQEMINEQYR